MTNTEKGHQTEKFYYDPKSMKGFVEFSFIPFATEFLKTLESKMVLIVCLKKYLYSLEQLEEFDDTELREVYSKYVDNSHLLMLIEKRLNGVKFEGKSKDMIMRTYPSDNGLDFEVRDFPIRSYKEMIKNKYRILYEKLAAEFEFAFGDMLENVSDMYKKTIREADDNYIRTFMGRLSEAKSGNSFYLTCEDMVLMVEKLDNVISSIYYKTNVYANSGDYAFLAQFSKVAAELSRVESEMTKALLFDIHGGFNKLILGEFEITTAIKKNRDERGFIPTPPKSDRVDTRKPDQQQQNSQRQKQNSQKGGQRIPPNIAQKEFKPTPQPPKANPALRDYIQMMND